MTDYELMYNDIRHVHILDTPIFGLKVGATLCTRPAQTDVHIYCFHPFGLVNLLCDCWVDVKSFYLLIIGFVYIVAAAGCL